ncbi:hypothetical protein NL676_009857 [Syzygium grande]|nr:hypothetical protein NL676_009857 [Syzygium grande]
MKALYYEKRLENPKQSITKDTNVAFCEAMFDQLQVLSTELETRGAKALSQLFNLIHIRHSRRRYTPAPGLMRLELVHVLELILSQPFELVHDWRAEEVSLQTSPGSPERQSIYTQVTLSLQY